MLSRLTMAGVLAMAGLLFGPGDARHGDRWPTPGSRIHLHAHNAYPQAGHWADRLERALASGAPHLAIEQDVAWVPPAGGRPGRSVVAHDTPLTGSEPTLDEHFFARVRPLMEAAIRAGARGTWPRLVLHLDFKTNEPEHHRYVWDLLGRHATWLTTAERTPAGAPPSPLHAGPLLVLTEDGDGQERDFHLAQPIGGTLRLFGTVPRAATQLPADEVARMAALGDLPATALIPSGATSYRRWTNQSWAVIEAGGGPHAGGWTPRDEARLGAVVTRAHAQGLWVRFYGLNGHAGDGSHEGWSAAYNFGSLDAVRARWRAAIAAGADFVATDQYEELARELRGATPAMAP